MKLFLTILIGVLIVTFVWGWVVDVHYGYMSTHRYAAYYVKEVCDTVSYFWEEAGKIAAFFAKPIPKKADGTWF